jgi:hypothetical protein
MTSQTNNESTPFSVETILDTLEAQKANTKVETTYFEKNGTSEGNITKQKLIFQMVTY